jgi:hypothetical protein
MFTNKLGMVTTPKSERSNSTAGAISPLDSAQSKPQKIFIGLMFFYSAMILIK